MSSSVTSFVMEGLRARQVRVAVDVHRGLPSFSIVGLPAAAVREVRERVRAAIVNSGFDFPLHRVVVDVASASARRAAPGLDLAIAVALLKASAQLDRTAEERMAFVGALGLDGTVRPIDGALAIAEAAAAQGLASLVTAPGNAAEAALAGGVEVLALSHLMGLPPLSEGRRPPRIAALRLPSGPPPDGPDLADIRGQAPLRLALEVAAAGGHHLFLSGPAGAGRSLAASRLPSILPPLDEEEALDVVRIAGATGRLRSGGVPSGRPFRAPHHTIGAAGLLGGGTPSRPGEVTLAHRGVLLLDDVGEFRRDVLAGLVGALDSGVIQIRQAGETRRFPCGFLLVATSEGCPCGRGKGRDRGPTATAHARLARQVLGDRLGVMVDLVAPTPEEIAGPPGESSATVRGRVMAARERAQARLGRGRTNAQMSAEEVQGLRLTSGAAKLLAAARAGRPLPRALPLQTLRVARTLADLVDTDHVGSEAMRTALGLRDDEGAAAA